MPKHQKKQPPKNPNTTKTGLGKNQTEKSYLIKHRTRLGDPITKKAVKEDVDRYLNAPDDVNPLDYLKHVKPQPQAKIRDVATLDIPTLLKTTRVLFYPACEFDWRPLIKFTTPEKFNCQTILYCDWHRDREVEFLAEIRNLPVELECEPTISKVEPGELTSASTVAPRDFLTNDEITSYQARYDMCSANKGWGRRVVLACKLGDGRVRKLNLIYLGAEGVATYLQVFTQQKIAPYMLCTLNCGVGFGCGWDDFRLYKGALGRAVKANPRKPTYIINEGGQPYNWPWNEEVDVVDGMRVFKRPNPAGSKPQKHPNPFRRREAPGFKPGPLPKPKFDYLFFGLGEKQAKQLVAKPAGAQRQPRKKLHDGTKGKTNVKG